MHLTPQDLWRLRNIIIRTVNEAHDVLAGAVRRTSKEGQRPAPTPPHTLPPTREPPPPSRFAYTLGEAAQLLSLSRSTLYKMMAQGELKTLRVRSRA